MYRAAVLLTLVACGSGAGAGPGNDASPDTGIPDGAVGGDAGVDAAVVPVDPLDPSVLHEIDIDIAPGDLTSFDVDQQTRVPCDIRWDGQLLAQSSCRKKGSSGSYDAVTGKPSFSIKLDDNVPGQKLGPYDKLLLDNAIQDPSLVHEHVSYEVFRRFGVAAHQSAFVLVTLNDEPRGVYVALEPVDKEFLRARFGAANDQGNLYESSSVDFALDPDSMDLKDPAGRLRTDLDDAAAAVVQSSDATFAADVGARIDLDWFVHYLAAEIALDAADGHSFGRNNYYLYHRPDTDRFVMLPHGQDVILDNPGFDADAEPAARLAIRVRADATLSAAVDAALAAAAAPGGALDDAALAARIDGALALVSSTTRDDDFTVGDLATMAVRAPVVKAQLAWRAARLRGEAADPRCGDGVVQANEQCDDGDQVDGDGCDAACFPECQTISGAGATWRLCPAHRDRATQIAACEAGGGSLVVPADPAEAATIAALVRRHLGSADVWLGVNDEATDGTWLTDTGGAPPYLGFSGSEPNGGAAENAAVLDTSTLGSWRDQPADVGFPALCRLP